jgi:type IV pilus assembly protein PilB
MRISDALVEKLLRGAKLATDEQLASLRAQEKTDKKPLQDLVVKNGLASEEVLTKLYATEIDVPFVSLKATELPKELLRLLPERIARQYKVVLFGTSPEGSKLLAMEDPDDIQAINFLRKTLGPDIKVHIATSTMVKAALDQYREGIGGELIKVISEDQVDDIAETVSEEDVAEDSPIAQTVNLLIEYAVRSNASDIHIEPRESFVLVRYRIDGMLREANKLPKKVLGALVSRIKILSNLKIDERRAPQDGRFKVEIGGQLYALRVSTLPVVDGEKVAMRILNESAKPANLQELGFWGQSLDDITQAIAQPHGMVLITGPTGSGKSTSLFSILSMINQPTVNISTVEDPIEYRIQGANQTQINPIAGMTFSTGLRALLRQDPNIIMVGEVRDAETANLAVQAALTGHLVFSTLHTNNAATCIPRLLDMKIEPFLIASTVRAVVGQRLVRRLCTACRQAFQPDEVLQQRLDEVFSLSNPQIMQNINQLEQKFQQSEPDKTIKPGSTPQRVTQLWRARDGGCDKCQHTGYKGRVGIYEVLLNTPGIQQLLINRSTSESIQTLAVKEGMMTMQIDGLIKALRGQTSVEEVMRVTSE